MGSWAELDAVYPPGALTPATALVVALGHLSGAVGAPGAGGPGALPPPGLPYDADLAARCGRYLAEVPVAQFLEEARALLTPRQKLTVALHLVDRQLQSGDGPEVRAMAAALIAGIGADADQLEPHRRTLALKNDLSAFPQ